MGMCYVARWSCAMLRGGHMLRGYAARWAYATLRGGDVLKSIKNNGHGKLTNILLIIHALYSNC